MPARGCRVVAPSGSVRSDSAGWSAPIESAYIRGGEVVIESPFRFAAVDAARTAVETRSIVFDGVNVKRTVDGRDYEHVIRDARGGVVWRDLHIDAAIGGDVDVRGIRLKGDNSRIVGGCWETDDRAIWADGSADCVVDGVRGVLGTNAIDTNGTDFDVVTASPSNIESWNVRGTRPRWNGVIGGGPLGGVDLGTTTGQFEGDKATADGTSGTAFLAATWDGSRWIQTDGTVV